MRDMGSTIPRLFSFSCASSKTQRAEFERVALPQMPQIYTAAVYLTRDPQEAEDLVQETFLRAFRFFDKFETGTNVKAWLMAIMRRLFINRYRRRKLEPETVDWDKIDQAYERMVDQGDHPLPADPEQQMFSTMMDDEVERALKALPEEFRMAVTLVDVQELTYEEAAKVMECPIGTVRSRVSRGRRLLQVHLKDYALERGLIKE